MCNGKGPEILQFEVKTFFPSFVGVFLVVEIYLETYCKLFIKNTHFVEYLCFKAVFTKLGFAEPWGSLRYSRGSASILALL